MILLSRLNVMHAISHLPIQNLLGLPKQEVSSATIVMTLQS